MQSFLFVLAFGLLSGLAFGTDTCPPDGEFPLTTTLETEVVECECNVCELIFNETSQPYETCLQHIPKLMYNSLKKHCSRLAARSDENLAAFVANLEEFCFKKEGVDIETACPICVPECDLDCDLCEMVFNVESEQYTDCLQFLHPLIYNSLEAHCYRLQASHPEGLAAFWLNLEECCENKTGEDFKIPECPDCVTCDPCDELLNPDGEFMLLCKHHLCPGELEIILEMCHAAVEHMSPRELWLVWDYVQDECKEHAELTEPLNLPWCNCELCLGLFNHTDDFMMRCGSLLGDCVGDVLWSQCEYARCDPEDWHDFKKMIEYTCNEHGVEDIVFADECVCNSCDLLFKANSSFMENCASLLCGETMDLVECECYNKQPEDSDAWKAWIKDLQKTCASYGGEFEVELCVPGGCDRSLDVIFVLDHSNSIDPEEFQDEKNFIMQIYHKFYADNDKIRVGVINYHHDPALFISLAVSNTLSEMDALVKPMTQMPLGLTHTGEALQMMADHFLANDIGNHQVGIVVTDGESNGPMTIPAAMAYVLGVVPQVTMYAVGTGVADVGELETIAGNDAARWSYVEEFQELHTLVEDLVEKVCA